MFPLLFLRSLVENSRSATAAPSSCGRPIPEGCPPRWAFRTVG